MRSVKLVIVAVFILLAFLFIISFLLPSKVTVSRSILINATPAKVSEQLINFKNWKEWYPPFRNKDLKVTASQVNDSSLAIFSNDKHKNLSIKLLRSDKDSISFLAEINKNEIEEYRFVIVANGHAKTLLTWNVNTNLGGNPWKKFTGLLLDKITGPDYEGALVSLKGATEKDSIFHPE